MTVRHCLWSSFRIAVSVLDTVLCVDFLVDLSAESRFTELLVEIDNDWDNEKLEEETVENFRKCMSRISDQTPRLLKQGLACLVCMVVVPMIVSLHDNVLSRNDDSGRRNHVIDPVQSDELFS